MLCLQCLAYSGFLFVSRCDSYTMQFTCLKCTIQCILKVIEQSPLIPEHLSSRKKPFTHEQSHPTLTDSDDLLSVWTCPLYIPCKCTCCTPNRDFILYYCWVMPHCLDNTTFCLLVHQLMDVYIVSTFLLLGIMLLWTHIYRFWFFSSQVLMRYNWQYYISFIYTS